MERTVTQRFDDFDHAAPAVETARFTIAGVEYEVDLGEASAAEWADVLAPWAAAGRRVKPPVKRKAPKGPSAAEVRAWAAQNGVQVSPMGAIPKAVREAYGSATG
jgi:hypothetical protein